MPLCEKLLAEKASEQYVLIWKWCHAKHQMVTIIFINGTKIVGSVTQHCIQYRDGDVTVYDILCCEVFLKQRRV